MSEQENLQTVQRIYKAFGEGDIPAILNLGTDDTEVLFYGSTKIPWAGSWRGQHRIEQYFKTIAEAAEVLVFHPDEFIGDRDSVVVLGHERVRVRATGRVVEANWAHVWAFRDGRVSRFREYSDTAALEAGFGGADA